MIKIDKKASMTIQYAALLMCVVMAGMGIAPYVQRSISGYWRAGADTFGHGRQYVTPPPPGQPSDGGEAPKPEYEPVPKPLPPLLPIPAIHPDDLSGIDLTGRGKLVRESVMGWHEGDYYDWESIRAEDLASRVTDFSAPDPVDTSDPSDISDPSDVTEDPIGGDGSEFTDSTDTSADPSYTEDKEMADAIATTGEASYEFADTYESGQADIGTHTAGSMEKTGF